MPKQVRAQRLWIVPKEESDSIPKVQTKERVMAYTLTNNTGLDFIS